MKTHFKTIVLIFLLISFVLQGCKVVEGCTDASAINYDADATKDDGSCCYKTISNYQFHSTTDGFTQQNGWQWYQIQVALNQRVTLYTGNCSQSNSCETKASFTSACPHDTIVNIYITHGIGGESILLENVLLPANGIVNLDQVIFNFCQPVSLENFDVSFE